jgi:hypothetical protein
MYPISMNLAQQLIADRHASYEQVASRRRFRRGAAAPAQESVFPVA